MYEQFMDNDSDRACGKARPGKIYLTVGFGSHGIPFENLIFDPAIPVPDKLEIPARGMNIVNFQGVDVVADHIGVNNYPDAIGWIEEIRQLRGLRVLVENTFPFVNLRPDMFYMPVHPHGCTLDTDMLQKFYEERLRQEEMVGRFQCLRTSEIMEDEEFIRLHMGTGENLVKCVDEKQYCAGFHWEALQDTYGIDAYRPIVTATLGEKVSFEGRVCPPNVPWHDAFIMFFPISMCGFTVWKDKAGEWETNVRKLEKLPSSLQSNINVFATESADVSVDF